MADSWLTELGMKAATPSRSRTFIYFIGAESGPIKIGKARNVKSRLSGIQTGHPEVLSCLGVMMGPERLEVGLHSRFSQYRLRGEWFDRSPEILQFIDQHTWSVDFAFTKSIPQEDRIVSLKRAVDADAEKLKAFAIQHFEEKLKADMIQGISDNFETMIEICQRFYEALDVLDKRLKQQEGHSIERRVFHDVIRTTLRKTLGCDWREAQSLLAEDISQERLQKRLMTLASSYLRNFRWNFNAPEKPVRIFKEAWQ